MDRLSNKEIMSIFLRTFLMDYTLSLLNSMNKMSKKKEDELPRLLDENELKNIESDEKK